MPNAKIIHLTDEHTPGCPTADEVRRFSCPWPTQPVNLETVTMIGAYYLAECGIEEMLISDPDMLYNANLEPLFADDYDVTLAARPAYDRVSDAYRRLYPYNSMMIVKNSQFVKDCYLQLRRFRRMNWARDMEARSLIVNSGKYKVRILDGETYNARPKRFYPQIKVYHFRIGPAKDTVMPDFYNTYIRNRDDH